MPESKQLSAAEVRRTISTSLAAAFGFVIALLWTNVVLSGLQTAGIQLSGNPGLVGWASLVMVAIVLTVVMIGLIVLFNRWSGKE